MPTSIGLLGDIPKTQNGIHDKDGEFTPYSHDYFYAPNSFVGVQIKVVYLIEELVRHTINGNAFPIKYHINNLIQLKRGELSPNLYALEIEFNIISKQLTDSELTVIVEITKCCSDQR